MLMLFYSIKLRNQTTLQGTPEFQKGSSYNDTTLQQKIKKKLKIIIYYKKKWVDQLWNWLRGLIAS